MRLVAFELRDAGPIKHVGVSDLADVVVLAGPNGVGKTSINNAILDLAREPRAIPNRWMVVEATDEAEKVSWGKDRLDTRVDGDAQILRRHLRRNQRRNRYHSSFLNFDSDRAVRNVQSFNFTWDIQNPFAEDVGWDLGMGQLSSRYNDVRHSLFRLVESQRREIADKAIDARGRGEAEMALDFPDPLQPFKDAFWQLLAPKRLVEISARNQQIMYEFEGQKLPIDLLSSGEKEVVNIVFDFLLRGPSHSIIVFDEPELHLHPELSYKLLQTLSRIGERNQFIFSSHSPEIISASLENTVVFVTPPQSSGVNQAVVVHRDDETHAALQTLGQSIGVISLGKKIILIEGDEASLDKQTYGAILKSGFPEFVLVPVGGKDTLRSFHSVQESVLNRTIWGVEFFLLADRDAANALGRRAVKGDATTKVKELPRYHLENFFLDASILAKAFEQMEAADSWLRDPSKIDLCLREIARSVLPYAVSLNVNAAVRESVGNVNVMPKGLDGSVTSDALAAMIRDRATTENDRISSGLQLDFIQKLTLDEYRRLSEALDDQGKVWMIDLPGRPIFNQFASKSSIQPGRLKQLYLNAAQGTEAFSEIVAIFEGFRAASS